MMRLSDQFEQRSIGAVFGSLRSRKQLPFPSGPQLTESNLESQAVEQLAASPFVQDLITQPIFRFSTSGRERQYSADILVDFSLPKIGIQRFVIEAKLQQDIDKNRDVNAPRFAAAIEWCHSNNATFCLLNEGDIKSAYLKNVHLLDEARCTCRNESALAKLSTLRLPQGSTVATVVEALVAENVDRPTAQITVEQAILTRMLDCDLTKPFAADTRIARPPSRGIAATRADPFLAVLLNAGRRGLGEGS